MITEIFGALILLISGLYIYYKLSVFSYWRNKGVYNVEPTFLTGNILPLLIGAKSNAEFFKNIYEQHKQHRLFGVYMLHWPCLIVTDPDLIRDVLAKEFTNFHDRGVYCNPEIDPLSSNLFQLSGKTWRQLRVKMTATFTSGKLKQIFPIMNETGDTLNKFFDRKAELKESVDVKDVFSRYTLDIIMTSVFGVYCDSLNDPNNEFRYWAKKIFEPRPLWNGLAFFAPGVYDFFRMPFTRRSLIKFFTTLCRDIIEQRQSHDIVRKDFMNLLIQLINDGYLDADGDSINQKTDPNTAPNKLTVKDAAAQAYFFFLAGFETSSTTAMYCLYELAKHQDMQDKVRDEIRTVVKKHGGITYNGLSEMLYLQKVISETMRKYPTLSMLNRICTNETKLETSDVTIPAGTRIIIPVYGLHWDPKIFPEPEKFDPERFSEENIKSRHSYAYLPFGEGPRICIGLRFGMVQVKVALINTLLNHRVKPTPNTPDTFEYLSGSPLLIPKGGVHLNVENVT